MATSGKLRPFVSVTGNAELYNTVSYPIGGTNPPGGGSGAPAPPDPNPSYNFVTLNNLREYYNLPYPPTASLASPPVIGIVSFGGGIYGQPVTSGQYAGFWKCTDISGANGLPIQILVAPINNAINAPNADDGGSTLENTVDVATVNAFYGMKGSNECGTALSYTPPIIILYIAPSNDISELYRTFYTVLNNPVINNGRSYLPSVVCCSWGAPEISWTQKLPFPPTGVEVDDDPSPAGISEINEINDLFATAVNKGINICVASGDIPLPHVFSSSNPITDAERAAMKSTIMFPASSPYVTCVGGSAVYFPNLPVQSYANASEFAWVRSDGGVSTAFPLPSYQSDLPSAAAVSAETFLTSSNNTADLAFTALGIATTDTSGLVTPSKNVSYATQTKVIAYNTAVAAYEAALAAIVAANLASQGDEVTIELTQAATTLNTAVATALANKNLALQALADAETLVVDTASLESLLKLGGESQLASNPAQNDATASNMVVKTTATSDESPALSLANKAVALAASAVIAPAVALLSTDSKAALAKVDVVVNDVSSSTSASAFPLNNYSTNLVPVYTPLTPINCNMICDLEAAITAVGTMYNDIDLSGNYSTSSAVYLEAIRLAVASLPDPNLVDSNGNTVALNNVIAKATYAARLVKAADLAITKAVSLTGDWCKASEKAAAANLAVDNNYMIVPRLTAALMAPAIAAALAANEELTAATVALADADNAALIAAVAAKYAVNTLLTAVSDSSFSALFTGTTSNVKYAAALTATTAAATVINTSSDLTRAVANACMSAALRVANVADHDAIEAYNAYVTWKNLDTSGLPTNITKFAAANAAAAAAARAAASTNALLTITKNVHDTVNLWPATTAAFTKAATDAANNLYLITVAIRRDPSGCFINKANPPYIPVDYADSLLNPDHPTVEDGYVDYDGIITVSLAPQANYSYLCVCDDDGDGGALDSSGVIIYFGYPRINTGTLASAVAVDTALVYPTLFTNPTFEATVATIGLAAAASQKAMAYAEAQILYAGFYGTTNPNHTEAKIIASTVAAYSASTFGDSSGYIDVSGNLHSGAIYDTFMDLSISAQKAKDLGTAARVATQYAMANVSAVIDATAVAAAAPILPATQASNNAALALATANQNTAINAAVASVSAFYDSVKAYDELVCKYSSIRQSLVDAAIKALDKNTIAAMDAMDATNSNVPTPVIAQIIENTESLILTALASARDLLSTTSLSDSRYPSRVNAVHLWEAAEKDAATAMSATDGVPATITEAMLNTLVDDVRIAYQFTTGVVVVNRLGASSPAPTLFNYPIGSTTTRAPAFELVTTTAYSTATDAYNASTYILNNVLYLVGILQKEIVVEYGVVSAALAGITAPSSTSPSGPYNAYMSRVNNVTLWNLANLAAERLLDSSGATIADVATAVINAYEATTGKNATTGANLSPQTYDVEDALGGSTPAVGLPSTGTFTNVPELVTTTAYFEAVRILDMLRKAEGCLSLQDNLANLIANSLASTNAAAAAKASLKNAVESALNSACIAKKSSDESKALATSTSSLEDIAAEAATEAAYAAADNVHFYRCIPDISMHGDVDDLPIVYRLNGGTIYVGGTSVAAAMFAGFLGVVQAHTPINFFINPILYNNYTYLSPFFNDISGSSEVWGSLSAVPARIKNIVERPLSGMYNSASGLGSIKGLNLAMYLEVPNLVTGMYPQIPTQGAVTVYPGTTATVTAYVEPASAYNTSLTWSISPNSYNATVSQTISTALTTNPFHGNAPCRSYTAIVSGLVALLANQPHPNVFATTTDGSNLYAVFDVCVNPAIQVTGISISAENEATNPLNVLLPINSNAATITPFIGTNPSNTLLFLGMSMQLIATVSPANATNKAVFWWSSNSAVVNVDFNGKITGLAPGYATIKATTLNNNISAVVHVYVPTPITGISVLPHNMTLNPNTLIYPVKNKGLITATVTPANVDYKALTWTILSSQALHLPAGTKDQVGNPLYYGGNNTITTPVISVPVTGTIISADSQGNIIDNTKATVTAITNGTAVINVSTDPKSSVYGMYSANVTVNVITPITAVTLKESNTVITMNPETVVEPLVSDPFCPCEDPKVGGLAQSSSITATLFPKYPSNMNVIWTSSNPKVAIVSNNTPPVLNTTASDPNVGLFQITERVIPLSNGTTVISIITADGNKVASTTVTVTTSVTGLTLNPASISLNPGKTYAIQAVVSPSSASNPAIIWESTNTSVATVDNNGVVKGVSTGSCAILAVTVDGDYHAMTTVSVITPLVGIQLVVNTPLPLYIGQPVQIMVAMIPVTASNQEYTYTYTSGVNGAIFSDNGSNGNIVTLTAVAAGTSVFTVTSNDGNKQANISLTVLQGF